jgi:hypothetical protein
MELPTISDYAVSWNYIHLILPFLGFYGFRRAPSFVVISPRLLVPDYLEPSVAVAGCDY